MRRLEDLEDLIRVRVCGLTGGGDSDGCGCEAGGGSARQQSARRLNPNPTPHSSAARHGLP